MTSFRESAVAEMVGRLKTGFEGADVSSPTTVSKIDSIFISNVGLANEEVAQRIFRLLDEDDTLAIAAEPSEKGGNDIWTLAAVLTDGNAESGARAVLTVTYIQEQSHMRISLQWVGAA